MEMAPFVIATSCHKNHKNNFLSQTTTGYMAFSSLNQDGTECLLLLRYCMLEIVY